jgi:hypothetical protein|tara:strand:- start:1145 stop:1432 length:288 start_codon:yes stop_codon:yes gene_type:complete
MKYRIGRLKTITQYIFRDQIEFDTDEYPMIVEELGENFTKEDLEEWFNNHMYDQDVGELNKLVDQEEIYDNSQKEEAYYLYVQPTLEDLKELEKT